jgi:hypothetical protein
MFKRRTLFIVGAGASVEVGMPVGIDLAKRIVKLVDFEGADPGPSPNSGDGDMIFLGQFHRRFGIVDAYRQAGWAIRDGVRLTHSIDDFLDMHNGNETVQRMGKAAIVQTILAAETDSSLFFNPYGYQETFNKIEGTWFMKFFRMLGRGINLGNAKNIFEKVSFITFNYDRSIEHFLIHALSLVYTMSLEDAASIVGNLNIIHPYGTVGDLPLLSSDNPVPYGPLRGSDKFDYTVLAERIKTYTEQADEETVLKKILALVDAAECVVFLGFAYYSQHMQMLRTANRDAKVAYGTTFGLSNSDAGEVHKLIAQTLAPSAVYLDNLKCAALFDNYAQSLTGGD